MVSEEGQGFFFFSKQPSFTVAEIGLNQTSYDTTENSGTVQVCAELMSISAGGLDCDVTVLLSTSNGTAIGLFVRMCG